MRALQDYRCLVFDCDGVVLDSNRAKTDAFYQTALPYGEAAARAFADYHRRHGGVSRYRKFEYFLQHIVEVEQPEVVLPDLLERYAALAYQGLLQCAAAPGLDALRARLPDARWMIVSGGDQEELRRVFAERGLDGMFDGGIFGSPVAKDEILARELGSGHLSTPALFLGDSRFDHQCARAAGLDFVFLSGWSEFEGWQAYCEAEGIAVRDDIASLLHEGLAQ